MKQISRVAVVALVVLTITLMATAAFSQSEPQLVPYVVTTIAGTGVNGTCTPGDFNATPPTLPDCQNGSMHMNNDGSSLATAVNIGQPYAIAFDSIGQMYLGVYDNANNGYILRVDTAGMISLFAGGMKQAGTGQTTCATGTDAYGSGCPANRIFIKSVRGIAIAPNGDLYFNDSTSSKIRKIDRATGIMSPFAGGDSSGHAEGPLGTGALTNPYQMTFDKSGNLYVTDRGIGAIERIDSEGSIHFVVNTAGTLPTVAPCPVASSGKAGDTQLWNPDGIAFDQDGNMYVADNKCVAVYKILVNPVTGIVDKDSTISIYAGVYDNSGTLTQGANKAWSAKERISTTAQGVAVDLAGNVYIGDGSRIFFCDAKTDTCHPILGNSSTPTGCAANSITPYDGCPGNQAVVTGGSYGLAFDPWGNLYSGDSSSSKGFRVRKLSLGTNGQGSMSSLVHFGAADGPGSLDTTMATDFAVTLDSSTNCAAANSDTTQDCVITSSGPASGSLYEFFTVSSSLGLFVNFDITNVAAPVCQPPSAQDQSVTVSGSSADITLSGRPGPGCAGYELSPPTPHQLVYAKGSDPAHGSVTCAGASCTYTPDSGFSGADSFTYTASDGKVFVADGDPNGIGTMEKPADNPLVSAPATVTITVPEKANAVPVATDVTGVTTAYGTAVTITLTATDADSGDTLSYSVVQDPAHGTLGPITGNQVTYTPADTYSGPDTFSFIANDGKADSNTATVSVVVSPEGNAVPVASDVTGVTTAYGTAVTIALTATDADSGDTLSYSVVQDPAHGTLGPITGNQVTYTPADTYSGPDTFSFKASDGKADSNTASVAITVSPKPNTAPVATGVTGVTTAYGTAVTITLTATDADSGDTLSYSVVQDPANGSLGTINGNKVVYTPASGYSGPDTFSFKASDGKADSNTAPVSITVLPAAPVAQSQAVTLIYNSTTTIVLSATGSGTLTYSVTSPSHGTLTGTAPNLTYTPSNNYIGSDSFTFTAKDASNQVSSAATVSITVSGDLTVTAPSGSSTSASVAAGQIAQYSLQIAGWPGATGQVSFACSGAPNLSTCTVAPNPATLNGTNASPFNVSIATTGTTTAAAGSVSIAGPGNGLPLGLALTLAGILATLILACKSKKQWQAVGAFAALLMVVSLSACGNSKTTTTTTPTSGTAPGSYPVTVTATAGSVTKTILLTLNVR